MSPCPHFCPTISKVLQHLHRLITTAKKKKKQPTTTTNIYNAKTKITQSDDVDDPGNTNLHTGLEYIRIIPSYSEHASMLTEIKWSEL